MEKQDSVQDVKRMLKLKTFIKEEVEKMDQYIVNLAHQTKHWKDKENLKLNQLNIKVDVVLDVDMINIMEHSIFII